MRAVFLVKQDKRSLHRPLLPRDWTKMNMSRFRSLPGYRGNNVFGAHRKTKTRGNKMRRSGLVIFAPLWALPRYWGTHFCKKWKPEKCTKLKYSTKTFIFNEERTVFCTMKKTPLWIGHFLGEKGRKTTAKIAKKALFLHPKWPQTHKKPSFKQILGNGPPKCHFAEPQTRKNPSLRLCSAAFQNYTLVALLKREEGRQPKFLIFQEAGTIFVPKARGEI